MATFVGPLNLGGTFSGSALDAFGQRLRAAFPGLTGLTSFVAPGGRGVNALGFTHPRADLFAGQPPSSLDAALAQQPSAVFQGVGTITPESITSAIAGLGQGHTSSPNIAQPSPPPSVTFPGQPPIPPDLLPGDIPGGATAGAGQSIAGGPTGGPSVAPGPGDPGFAQVGPTFGQTAQAIANAPSLTSSALTSLGVTNPTANTIATLGVNAALSGTPVGAFVSAANAVTKGIRGINAAQEQAFTPEAFIGQQPPSLPEGLTQDEVGFVAPPAAPPAPVAPVQTFTRDIQGLGPVNFSVDPQTNIPVTNQFGLFSDPTNMFGIAQPKPGFSGMFGNTSNFAGQPQGPAIGDVGPGEGPGPGPGGSSSGSTGSGSSGDPGTGGEGGAGGGPGGAAGSTGSGSSGDPGTGGEGQGGPGTGGGGGGGDGGGGTVICTELHRRGLLDDATLRANHAYLRRMGPAAHRGYVRWAAPLVRLARSSPLVFAVLWIVGAPLVRAYMREIAFVEGLAPTGSRLGRLVLAVAIPLCRRLGGPPKAAAA